VVKKKTVSRASTAPRELDRAGVEHLLSGKVPEDSSLGRLPSVVEALRRVGGTVPAEAQVQRFAAEAAKLVPDTPGRPPSRALRVRGVLGRPGLRFSPRLAGAFAALVVTLSAFGGLAYAANGAVPGDALYGLDLALEKMEIGDGGLQERLTEASQLVERGQAQEGLNLASDAITRWAEADEAIRAAADALRAAVDAAADNEDLQSPEGRALVAERLRWMASMGPTAEEFGQAVRDLAGNLMPGGQTGGDAGQGPGQPADDSNAGNGAGQGPSDSGQPNGNPNGSGNGPPR
jgi:hypothetical protein